MKYIAHLFCFFCITLSFAQSADSTEVVLYDRWKLAPRFGISVQRNAFAEVGISLSHYKVGYNVDSNYSVFSAQYIGGYLSSEVLIRGDYSMIGPKFGVDLSGFSTHLSNSFGLELTAYTDFRKTTPVITPRLGLSFLVFDVSYGYNFLLNKDLGHYIGRHRLSVIINLNRAYFRSYNDGIKIWRKQTFKTLN